MPRQKTSPYPGADDTERRAAVAIVPCFPEAPAWVGASARRLE